MDGGSSGALRCEKETGVLECGPSKNNRSCNSPNILNPRLALNSKLDERVVVRQGAQKRKRYQGTSCEVTLKSVRWGTSADLVLFIRKNELSEHGAPLLAPSCGPLATHFYDCRPTGMSPVHPDGTRGVLLGALFLIRTSSLPSEITIVPISPSLPTT